MGDKIKDIFKEKKELIFPGLLFLIVIVVFSRITFNDFVYDDWGTILGNPIINIELSPISYFKNPKALMPIINSQPADVYRPLFNWFLSLESHLFGPDPFYFHLISLLLHAANALLFFFLLEKIFKNSFLSFLASLVFALHPLTTESVAWASQQAGLWAWFFSFLALNLIFIEEKKDNLFFDKEWKKVILLAIFSFGAVFSKEQAVILPFLCLLSFLVFKKSMRKHWLEIGAIFLPVIFYFIIRLELLGSLAQMEPWGGGRYVIFLTMLKGFLYYFKLFVWPHPLSVVYDSFPLEKT
ncbi:MAG: glycosyltransferase family 39 protein, partial [Minisyncoccales bacterium]